MLENLDALFIPFYVDADRWHNDTDADYQQPSLSRSRAILSALSNDKWMKDEVDLVIDGKLYDFSRFLSLVGHGTTRDWERYDPFNMTLLSGSYYLNLLSQRGLNVRVVNAAHRDKLSRLARKYDPRFVLLSTTLLFDAVDKDLVPLAVSQIRKAWPEAIVVLGGLSLVSHRKNLTASKFEQRLSYYNADVYVVSARGENSLLDILSRPSLTDIASGPSIPNTYVIHKGKIIAPGSAVEPEMSMDQTYIRWSGLPHPEQLYHTVHTRTARSCAFNCAFCEYPVNQGPLTLASTETVTKEFEELRKLGMARSIIFTDDTFNVPLARFKEILTILNRFEFEWYSFFRPQYVDAETAALMKSSGCKGVFAGLESANDQVLKNMNKKATVDKYRKGIEFLKKNEIRIHANFIVGFPGETVESARAISALVDEMEIDFCTICTWAYIPSTPIAERKQEFGLEGMGVEWKHSTMCSDEAEQLARRVALEQKAAIHNAVRGEAWTEFLLYANGWSLDETRLAIRSFNSFLGRDVSYQDIAQSSDCAVLGSILGRHPMPMSAS
jgi:radical SAM superfamily enzyme YgiQ (UPF0313 family)